MTGTNSLIVGGAAAGGSAATSFLAVAGGFYESVNTEGFANTKFQSSAMFSGFGMNAKSTINPTTFVFRNNGSNGNQTITFATNADTFQSDSTHTDSITANSALDFQYGSNLSGTIVRFWNLICNAPLPLTWYGTGAAGSTGETLSSTPHYANMQGSTNQASASTAWGDGSESRLQSSGVLSDMGMMIATAPTGAVSANTYHGTNGNQALSFSAGTGFMQDLTHTDSVTSGQDWGYVSSSANSSGAWTCMQCQFAGVKSQHDMGSSTDNAQAASPYYNVGGFFFWGSATESEIYTGAPFAFVANLLRLRTQTASTSSGTCVIRINSANGNETVAFSSQVGLMVDTTHTDSITAAALFDFSISAGTTWGSLFISGDDGSYDRKGGLFFHSFPP